LWNLFLAVIANKTILPENLLSQVDLLLKMDIYSDGDGTFSRMTLIRMTFSELKLSRMMPNRHIISRRMPNKMTLSRMTLNRMMLNRVTLNRMT
jgi:hypothetical protein